MQYPYDYVNKIICGDCLEIVKNIPDNSVDLVLTDPPYGWNLTPDYSKYTGGLKYSKIIGDEKQFDFAPWVDFKCKEQFWFGAENYINLPPAGSWFCWDKYPTDKNDKRLSGAFELVWSKKRHTRKIIKVKAINTSWVTVKERVGHPTQKPVELMIWFIERFSKLNDLIFDPFIGSGTTAIACLKTNRRFIGVEIDPKYCEIARERIKNIAV